jgi:CubicO group peptidase (beta-lactamase class C family)
MQKSGARARALSASITRIDQCAALALGLMLLPALALAAAPAQCGAPADMHDGWTVAAPAQEGLDPKVICATGPRLEKMTDADANGVVVVRHGVLVYEHYFTGDDDRWGRPLVRAPHNANTLHDLRSITKSVTAILTGIALDRGWLKSLDTPVFSFFPRHANLRTPGKDRITLRDLLTMTSGLAWPEWAVSYGSPANIVREMGRAPDPYRFVLARPLAATPGTVWNYDSGGVELIGVILEKVAGRPLAQFAKQALFDPLGIEHWEWFADGAGSAAWGLRLRPRDLAKLGQLVLNRGMWHGQRIVSAAWIKQMTARQSPRGWMVAGCGCSYGYLWWRDHLVIDNHDVDWVGGLGLGGQRLYVVPNLDLVVAVTAGDFPPHDLSDVAGDTTLATAVSAAFADKSPPSRNFIPAAAHKRGQ